MHVPGPYQEKAQQIYKDLRSNIIQNVFAVSYFAAFSFSLVVWIYEDLLLCFVSIGIQTYWICLGTILCV
jgi:hypothetical protein